MNKELQHKLGQSYQADLMEAIERARKGELSPNMQEYCFEEIEGTKGTEEYPADGDSLFEQLREALSTHTQISDREQAEAELQALGAELLVHVSIDRFTFAEITYLKETNLYDGRIYINGDKHKANLIECVAAMRKEFETWLANEGISYDRAKVQMRCPDPCDGRFETLEEAIALVYDGLENPQTLI